MRKTKQARLEAAGWRVGSAEDFLELSPEEIAFIELKLVLSQQLQVRRRARHLSQAALAKRLGSSQSRVAKMEAADPSVSLDLLVRSLLALGVDRKEMGKVIAERKLFAAV